MKIIEGKEQEYQEYRRKNSADAYSFAVIRYTEKWADLMEERMATDNDITHFADQTSHLADTEGITGFMYGCAVSALAHFWQHGEALRKWHNIARQLRDEGEKANQTPGAVLNPALLNFE